MNLKKITGIIAAAVLAVSSVSAVSLETVCAGLAAHPHTTGNFTQVKKLKANGRSIKSSGNFIFGLDGIMWNTVKPFPSTLAVGETRIIQTAADGSRTIIEAEGNPVFGSIAGTLTAVFSNDLTNLKENFTTDFSEKEGGAWTLVLTPKDQTITAVLNTLTLEGSSGAEYSMDVIILEEASGNTITYSFFDQKYPKELTDAEKAFFEAE